MIDHDRSCRSEPKRRRTLYSSSSALFAAIDRYVAGGDIVGVNAKLAAVRDSTIVQATLQLIVTQRDVCWI